MKITLDIDDVLLSRAKARAKLTGRPLRVLVEEGLRLVLSGDSTRQKYTLPDLSVGKPDSRDPLEACSWQDMRELIHGER
jgi:hypothetical protein